MRIVETAWLAQPHPDLADAYAHVKLGDSARQRLVRVETLAAKTPGHIEGALAIARAAIDASEFANAREALAPFIAAPTQRVAMLMAEIERTEHGDSGRARAWTLRAVRALHDPAWTADGYVTRSLAAGVAGHRAARRASNGRRRSRRCRPTRATRSRSLAVRGSHAGGARTAVSVETPETKVVEPAHGRHRPSRFAAPEPKPAEPAPASRAGQRAAASGTPSLRQSSGDQRRAAAVAPSRDPAAG